MISPRRNWTAPENRSVPATFISSSSITQVRRQDFLKLAVVSNWAATQTAESNTDSLLWVKVLLEEAYDLCVAKHLVLEFYDVVPFILKD